MNKNFVQIYRQIGANWDRVFYAHAKKYPVPICQLNAEELTILLEYLATLKLY